MFDDMFGGNFASSQRVNEVSGMRASALRMAAYCRFVLPPNESSEIYGTTVRNERLHVIYDHYLVVRGGAQGSLIEVDPSEDVRAVQMSIGQIRRYLKVFHTIGLLKFYLEPLCVRFDMGVDLSSLSGLVKRDFPEWVSVRLGSGESIEVKVVSVSEVAVRQGRGKDAGFISSKYGVSNVGGKLVFGPVDLERPAADAEFSRTADRAAKNDGRPSFDLNDLMKVG